MYAVRWMYDTYIQVVRVNEIYLAYPSHRLCLHNDPTIKFWVCYNLCTEKDIDKDVVVIEEKWHASLGSANRKYGYHLDSASGNEPLIVPMILSMVSSRRPLEPVCRWQELSR